MRLQTSRGPTRDPWRAGAMAAPSAEPLDLPRLEQRALHYVAKAGARQATQGERQPQSAGGAGAGGGGADGVRLQADRSAAAVHMPLHLPHPVACRHAGLLPAGPPDARGAGAAAGGWAAQGDGSWVIGPAHSGSVTMRAALVPHALLQADLEAYLVNDAYKPRMHKRVVAGWVGRWIRLRACRAAGCRRRRRRRRGPRAQCPTSHRWRCCQRPRSGA